MNDIVDAARKIRELQTKQNTQRPDESVDDFEQRAFDTLNLEYEWIGGITYRGNSVSWIHGKAQANGRALMEAWTALAELGIHPDGQTKLADAIRKLKPR